MENIRWKNLILELLVVVFGVTIAFSLNNWNDGRKARKVEQEYLASFRSDLEQDIQDLGEMIDTLKVQKQNCNQLIRCIYSNDLKNDSLLTYSLSLFFVTTFVPREATYRSISSSGQLLAIHDFDLRKKIVDHYEINYAGIRLLDEFNQKQVFDYKTPFLHDNLRYTYNGILNTEIMQSSKYINMTMSTFYFLDRKITDYSSALNKCQELIALLDAKIKS